MTDKRMVSKFFPEVQKVGTDSGGFLRQLRDTVQDVKTQDPELTDLHLCDLGFVQQDGGLEVRMYFGE